MIRGRTFSPDDLSLIRSLIDSDGPRGRFWLSQELCRRWRWLRPDGRLKDAACRAALLRLEARDLIQLPPRQNRGVGQRAAAKRQAFLPLEYPEPPALHESASVHWRLAQSVSETALYRDLIQTYHYLGYRREVGPSLRYVAYVAGAPVACLRWSAAAWKVAVRDQFIGWDPPRRQGNLHRIVNNSRFLVLVHRKNLASHLLSSNLPLLRHDWQAAYGYAPVLLETFVDTTRFKGTCYKAANWIGLGNTQGRGKWDRRSRRAESVKAVFVYPLRPDFREALTHG